MHDCSAFEPAGSCPGQQLACMLAKRNQFEVKAPEFEQVNSTKGAGRLANRHRSSKHEPTCGYSLLVRTDLQVLVQIDLWGSGKEDWFHHRFNLGSHFLSGNAVRSLVPPSRGAKDGPGRRGCEQFGIGSRYHLMVGGAFLKHILHDRDDGTFKGHLSQLARAARSLGEIIADAQRNGT